MDERRDGRTFLCSSNEYCTRQDTSSDEPWDVVVLTSCMYDLFQVGKGLRIPRARYEGEARCEGDFDQKMPKAVRDESFLKSDEHTNVS